MSAEPLSDCVTLRRPAPHVALITIERPEARNAVNAAVAQGIARGVDVTEADVDTWVVIVTGAGGKSFCAGADLKEVAVGRAMTLRTEQGGFAGFTHRERGKPWIAAVDGFAVGGGCEIALACDMIVAAETAVFGLPEPKRGLIAAAGGIYRLPRVLPRQIALELIATGADLPATRAHQLGMVNRLAPAGQVVEEALKLAAQVCACAPVAVAESLKVARVAADYDDATLKQQSVKATERNAQSADYQEGPRAFIEKRAPQWSGR
jgi:enoyl-CoA hydratase